MWYMFKKDEIATACKNLTIGNLENFLEKSWDYIVQYKRSFVVFGVIIVGVTALFFSSWIKMSAREIFFVFASLLTCVSVLALFIQLSLQAKNDRKQIATEQFKNAVDQLGSKEQAVVLGGVHALHNLAMTFPNEYSQQVFEILCSFIREETTKNEYQEKVSVKIEPSAKKQTALSNLPSQDTSHIVVDTTQITLSKPPIPVTSLNIIRTIVDKIFRYQKHNESVYIKYRATLIGTFLRRITFFSANLKLVNLRDADLQGTILCYVNLQGANLSGANLQETDLGGAHLQGANLCGTHLQGANLKDADFRGVKNLGKYLHVHRKAIEESMKNETDLETDLSGITLYDDEGNELNLDEDGKKAWFRKRGAKVENLPAKEVQELFRDFEYFITQRTTTAITAKGKESQVPTHPIGMHRSVENATQNESSAFR